jgi:hypothetical protein
MTLPGDGERAETVKGAWALIQVNSASSHAPRQVLPGRTQPPVGRVTLAGRENAHRQRAVGMRYDWVLVLEVATAIAIVALALVLWF